MAGRFGGSLADAAEAIDTVFAHAPVGVALLDHELQPVRANAALAALDGVTEAAALEALYRAVLESGEPVEGVVHCDPDRYFSLHAFPVREAGHIAGLCSILVEITERVAREGALSHAATHDGLTGLPNRELLLDRLEHALERLARHGGRLGLLFCDVDSLKPINDAFGHDSGDRLLAAVAERLHSVVRAEDTLARYGGDEFVILIEDLPDAAHLQALAARAAAAVQAPLVLDDAIVEPSVSIGTAWTDEREPAGDLLRRADEAMYAQKRAR